jgi:hypothetical protein
LESQDTDAEVRIHTVSIDNILTRAINLIYPVPDLIHNTSLSTDSSPRRGLILYISICQFPNHIY